MSDQPNRATWLEGPSSRCSPAPRLLLRPWRLALLGAPGVGKGTQAQLLHENLRACHLSTGDVFRAAAHRADCEQSPAMLAATEFMRRGALVPDETVWEMVRERSACLRCAGGFVLDGFPRTLPQAQALQTLLQQEGIQLDAVVNYELPLSTIVQRLSGRRTCTQCKAVFHITGRPPQLADVCDHCGSALVRREDDRPDSVTVRMTTYTRETSPLIDFYRGLGLLLSIPAAGSPEEIARRTITCLRDRRARAEMSV